MRNVSILFNTTTAMILLASPVMAETTADIYQRHSANAKILQQGDEHTLYLRQVADKSDVYLNQLGASHDLTVNQLGENNMLKVSVHGQSHDVTLNQGKPTAQNGNIAYDSKLNGTIAGFDNEVIAAQYGRNNNMNLDIGGIQNNVLARNGSISGYGSDGTINLEISGAVNRNNNATVTTDGTSATVNAHMDNVSNSQLEASAFDFSTVDVYQTGHEQSVRVDMSQARNSSAIVNQYGRANQVMVHSKGSDNHVDILQDDNTLHGNITFSSRNAVANVTQTGDQKVATIAQYGTAEANIIQTGATPASANVVQYGGYAGGGNPTLSLTQR